MLDFTGVKNYYIRCGYTDMRKQIDGLAALVRLEYDLELDEESLFLFCGRKADRIKVSALYKDVVHSSCKGYRISEASILLCKKAR